MAEIDLLKKYPKVKRNITERVAKKTEKIRKIARKFDKEYFDGDRKFGYGGYHYHPRFWRSVVKDFRDYYKLTAASSILDVGCGKGFMLHDFAETIPGINLRGIDISEYAIQHAIDDMKPNISIADAKELPFADKSFDLVISINTVHNLALKDCKLALREIQRVTKRYSFITIDAYRSAEEKKRLEAWNLTALTYMSVGEWKKLFAQLRFQGDYYWFIP